MPKGYHHLTQEQRCQIYALLQRGLSNREMAEQLKVDSRTIDREISRNKGMRGYRYKQAQNKATKRRRLASERTPKMTAENKKIIEKLLIEEQWSPEQISISLKLKANISISHEAIYCHIWDDKAKGGTLYKHLRNSGKKYNKRQGKNAGRGLIPNRVDISKRPKIVEEKKRVGDFEGDTIIGAHHRGAIVSLVDRVTKMTFLELVDQKTAAQTAKAIKKSLKPIKEHVRTITVDNGKEFAHHEQIAKALNAGFYFAEPYCSWQRALNENTNKLVRQYFPKKLDFSKLTNEHVKCVQNKLNNRPRKTLGFKTPLEVFLELTNFDRPAALQS